VRLLAELEVDDEDLRQEERDRELPPRQMGTVPERRTVVPGDRDSPYDRTDDRDDAVEGPNATPRA
jgi:hypothetical protein